MIGLTSGWTLVDLFHISYAFIELVIYTLIYGWSEAIIAKCKQDQEEEEKRNVKMQKRRMHPKVAVSSRSRIHERLAARQTEEVGQRQQNAVTRFESEQNDRGRLFTVTRTHLLLPAPRKYKKTNRLDNKVLLNLI
jgi:hypothetical protein